MLLFISTGTYFKLFYLEVSGYLEILEMIGNDICTVILEGNEITDIGSKTVSAISLTNTDYQLPLTNIEQTLVIKGGLFIKENGVWIPVKDVYKKTSSGWTRVPYEELKVELAKNSGKFVRKMT